MKIFGKEIHVFFSLFLWAAIWEIVGQAGWFEIFPPLSHIFVAGWEMVPTDKFQNAIDITIRAYFSGMILAVIIGIPLGALMGASKVVDRLIGTWVNIFVSAPLTALVPVLMVLFGIGQTTVIASVFLFAIWVIVLDTRAGVKGVNPSLPEMARSFGANPWTIFFRIYLLAALPRGPGRNPAWPDPGGQGRRHRSIAGGHHGHRRTVRTVFAQLPVRGVLGASAHGVRICLCDGRGRGVCRAPHRVLRQRKVITKEG